MNFDNKNFMTIAFTVTYCLIALGVVLAGIFMDKTVAIPEPFDTLATMILGAFIGATTSKVSEQLKQITNNK